ncbi:hypothetical protein TSUD_172820 [Trifolium subterraneum]|uniref:RNase H type-1 domain-containing protein n=1 Tax=Trifolium subterraneum TaxID=3900 RepID=A0A2Z6LZZ0_TRISU|nr:hypothetical protein TSUD_172820 [Trifolium subterraneum]
MWSTDSSTAPRNTQEESVAPTNTCRLRREWSLKPSLIFKNQIGRLNRKRPTYLVPPKPLIFRTRKIHLTQGLDQIREKILVQQVETCFPSELPLSHCPVTHINNSIKTLVRCLKERLISNPKSKETSLHHKETPLKPLGRPAKCGAGNKDPYLAKRILRQSPLVLHIVVAQRQKVEIGIAWQGPEEGWLSLNTDGASRGEVPAECGDLIRNSAGQWLGGFSRNLGYCSAYLAELWGVYDGLCLAQNIGATRIEVHVDSSVVVQTLNSTNGGSVTGWRLVQEIRRLLNLD